ncbi:MAG: hypothetical protein RL742_1830 [Bacteroidota bacterium]|jgi:hypothetical protein
MSESFNFDRLFKEWIENTWIGYAQILGAPAYPDAETFEILVNGLRDFKERHPDMAFWQIVSMKDLTSTASGGDLEVFGMPVRTYRDFLRLIHPDYLLPFLQWRNAGYTALVKMKIKMTPMEVSFRTSLPMRTKDETYHWFSQHTTIAQIDAEGRVVSTLHTLYPEGKWTPHSTKPFVAFFQGSIPETELEDMLRAQIVPYILDELTNGELDLISLYANDQSSEEICRQKGWSKHTLHEYNAGVLKKAKRLFQFEFRNARDFAAFCLDRGFIYKKNERNP